MTFDDAQREHLAALQDGDTTRLLDQRGVLWNVHCAKGTLTFRSGRTVHELAQADFAAVPLRETLVRLLRACGAADLAKSDSDLALIRSITPAFEAWLAAMRAKLDAIDPSKVNGHTIDLIGIRKNADTG